MRIMTVTLALGTALAFCQANPCPAAVLSNKFDAGLLKSSDQSFRGLNATANLALGSFQSFHRRCRNPGAFRKIRLRPAEQSSRRFNLPD